MTRLDRAVAAVLALALAVLGLTVAIEGRGAAGPDASPDWQDQLPGDPATYREGFVGRPVSVTPVTARGRAERALVGLVFSGLVRSGPGGTLEPDLAEAWTPTDDGTGYTFTLRADATWHDGAPVTADDVAFTVGTLAERGVPGPGAASWAEVTATRIDARTVTLTTATPLAGLLAAATQPLLPAHLLAEVAPAELATGPFSRAPIGTGPFALRELTDDRALLERVAAEPGAGATAGPAATPVAADGVRPVDLVEFRFFDDAAALAAAFTDGELDAAGLPAAAAADLAASTGARLLRYPTTTLTAGVLNLRPTHPELRDPRVRRALLAAVDRDALIRDVLGTGAVRADAPVPPASPLFAAAPVARVAHDPAAAAALLAEAGWTLAGERWAPPGSTDPYPLEVLTVEETANPTLAAVAAALVASWRDLGFEATLAPLPASELSAALREGQYTAAVVDVATAPEPDLYPFLASSQATSRGGNVAGYQDPSFDTLLAAARRPATDAARRAAWAALLTGFAERLPVLPLLWPDDCVVVRGVSGQAPQLLADPGDRYWDVLAWRLAADR